MKSEQKNKDIVAFLHEILPDHYGLQPKAIEQTEGGWSALAFAARADQEDWFIKVYERNRPSAGPWMARIVNYMPAVMWLNQHTLLHGRMTAPLLTRDGAYKVENDAYLSMVFPFIHGETLAEARMDAEQAAQLGEILAELHSHGAEIPAPTDALREDFALDFLDSLAVMLGDETAPGALRTSLDTYAALLARAMEKLRALACGLQAAPPPFALCHTDVHGWNLMWDGALKLIDWEGLRLAPVEADLFSFTDGFFFDYARQEFLAAYRAARPDYAIHEDAMAFCRLRRRLEDIEAFALSICADGLDEAESRSSLEYMEKECIALEAGEYGL